MASVEEQTKKEREFILYLSMLLLTSLEKRMSKTASLVRILSTLNGREMRFRKLLGVTETLKVIMSAVKGKASLK